MNTDTRHADFVAAVLARVEAALAIPDAASRAVCIGGCAVRLVGLGAAWFQMQLTDIGIDMGHDAATSATWVLIERRSSGVAMPPCPWRWDDPMPRREIRALGGREVVASWHPQHLALSLYDATRRVGVYWTESVAPSLRADPLALLDLVQWTLAPHGRVVLPGGLMWAAGDDGDDGDDGAWLVPGPAACAREGLDTADAVVVATAGPPRAWPVRRSNGLVSTDGVRLLGVRDDAGMNGDSAWHAAMFHAVADRPWAGFEVLAAVTGVWKSISRHTVHEPVIPAPVLSVVIPCHNGARFLNDCVASIRANAPRETDIIVVDDGSTDDSVAVAAAISPPVRIVRQTQQGPAAARNRGLRETTTPFVTCQDVDDLYTEGALRMLVDVLRRDPQLSLVQGFSAQMGVDSATGATTMLQSPHETFASSIASAVWRRELLEHVGDFDAGLRFGEDADWFHRIAESGLRTRRVEAVTLVVRRHDANMTAGRNLLELNTLQVLKRRLDRLRVTPSGVATPTAAAGATPGATPAEIAERTGTPPRDG